MSQADNPIFTSINLSRGLEGRSNLTGSLLDQCEVTEIQKAVSRKWLAIFLIPFPMLLLFGYGLLDQIADWETRGKVLFPIFQLTTATGSPVVFKFIVFWSKKREARYKLDISVSSEPIRSPSSRAYITIRTRCSERLIWNAEIVDAEAKPSQLSPWALKSKSISGRMKSWAPRSHAVDYRKPKN